MMHEKGSGKEYKRWRKSVTKDEMTKSVEVEECENGFIITICNDGKVKGEWEYNTKKYISTKNPLEGEKEYDEEIDIKKEILESIKAMDI